MHFFAFYRLFLVKFSETFYFKRSVGAKNGYSFVVVVVVVVCWFAFVFFVTKFVVHSLSAVSKNIWRVLLTMTSHHIGNWCMT